MRADDRYLYLNSGLLNCMRTSSGVPLSLFRSLPFTVCRLTADLLTRSYCMQIRSFVNGITHCERTEVVGVRAQLIRGCPVRASFHRSTFNRWRRSPREPHPTPAGESEVCVVRVWGWGRAGARRSIAAAPLKQLYLRLHGPY